MLQNALTGEPPVGGGVEPCPVPTPPYRRGLIRCKRNLDKSGHRSTEPVLPYTAIPGPPPIGP